MLETLASLFTLVMRPCYELTGNWWMAIALFTALIKLALMPLSLWCQWNSIVMVKLMPALNRIKVKYFGDAETIGERQAQLTRNITTIRCSPLYLSWSKCLSSSVLSKLFTASPTMVRLEQNS